MSRRLKDLTPLTSALDTDALVVVTDTDTNLLTLANLRTSMLTKASTEALGAVIVGDNLSVDENGVLSAQQSTIPSQTGNAGKYLTTNGTTVSWATVTVPSSLPSQTGNAGKYLKTNGTTVTWEPVPIREELPAKTNNSGKFLSNNGTNLIWVESISLEALKAVVDSSASWEDFKTAIANL